ncbi:MAG: glycosyltransferase family 4 protein [Actinomycetota bacterium]|nr:glycosyltransferase family 4 protein [Actinomycetota bacterium]
MRIGIVSPPWAPVPPRLYGGIEQAIDGLARGFQAAGHEVLMFTTGDSTSQVPKKWLLAISEGWRMGYTVPELRHVMAAYDELTDYDVIHDHSVLGPVYAERFPGLPVVTTVHGPFNEELTDIYRRVAARVPIIAISNAQRRVVPDLKIARVIHHGVDPAAFPFGNGDGGYCLFLGRMNADKGAQRAVDAARKAGIPLVMAGKCREPWEHQFFDHEIKPHLSEDITYAGEVPHEEKVELLANARCLLFPIRWNEPFGLVMLESMACGTPVLAFREGAAPEVVEDGVTGFLCDDENHMADNIGRVDSLDRADCRKAVETYFSLDRCVAEHLELFEDLQGP